MADEARRVNAAVVYLVLAIAGPEGLDRRFRRR